MQPASETDTTAWQLVVVECCVWFAFVRPK